MTFYKYHPLFKHSLVLLLGIVIIHLILGGLAFFKPGFQLELTLGVDCLFLLTCAIYERFSFFKKKNALISLNGQFLLNFSRLILFALLLFPQLYFEWFGEFISKEVFGFIFLVPFVYYIVLWGSLKLAVSSIMIACIQLLLSLVITVVIWGVSALVARYVFHISIPILPFTLLWGMFALLSRSIIKTVGEKEKSMESQKAFLGAQFFLTIFLAVLIVMVFLSMEIGWLANGKVYFLLLPFHIVFFPTYSREFSKADFLPSTK